MSRRFRTTKEVIDHHGHTEGCRGCGAAIVGLDHREHPQECRRRQAECLEGTEEGNCVLGGERERMPLLWLRVGRWRLMMLEAMVSLKDQPRTS